MTNELTNRTRLPLIASLTAGAISQAGNNFTNIAIPWYVLATTGSAARMGIVGFVQLVPTVVSSVFGGALVDRVGHKRIAVIADVVSGLSVAAIPLIQRTIGLQFWQLLLLVFLRSFRI
jgi:MFS family permease